MYSREYPLAQGRSTWPFRADQAIISQEPGQPHWVDARIMIVKGHLRGYSEDSTVACMSFREELSIRIERKALTSRRAFQERTLRLNCGLARASELRLIAEGPFRGVFDVDLDLDLGWRRSELIPAHRLDLC